MKLHCAMMNTWRFYPKELCFGVKEEEMLLLLRGDLFDSKCEVLVNPVNCVGVMGKGLALEFKARFPMVFAEYARLCSAGILRPGKVILVENVLLFPTKDHWRDPSKLEYISDGLDDFATQTWSFRSIAFPRLGCGLGGLDWPVVRQMMSDKLADLDLNVEIYH